MSFFTKLALKGGGAKGYIYIGVAQAFEELDLLKNFTTIAGSSVGAIGSLLLGTGMSAQKIKEVMFKANIEQMLQDCWRIQEPFNFFRNGGLHEGKRFYEWFGEIIHSVTNDPNTTFLQWHNLKERHPEKNMKDIVVEACNLNKQFNEVFAWNNAHNDVSIRDAIRASMAFPILFTPWRIKGQQYSDGGLQANCPVAYFNGEKYLPDPQALGIWLDSKDIIQYIKNNDPPPPVALNTWRQQVIAMAESSLNAQTYDLLSNPLKEQIILCDTCNIGTLDFNLTPEQKEKLIQSGYNAVMGYLKTHHPSLFHQQTDNDFELTPKPDAFLPQFTSGIDAVVDLKSALPKFSNPPSKCNLM